MAVAGDPRSGSSSSITEEPDGKTSLLFKVRASGVHYFNTLKVLYNQPKATPKLYASATTPSKAFTAWDGDGDHKLSHFEFEKALGRCGVFLPAQEVNALFRRFDTRGDGHADTEQALSALRVPLSKRRLAVVDEAFSSIAAADAADVGIGTGDAVARKSVPLSEAIDRMHPQEHPEVVAGRLEATQVNEDFRDFFASRTAKSDGGSDGSASSPRVTLEGFREYYRDVGVCEPYDTVFIPMMEALWGIQEPHPSADKQSELGKLLQPKLLQHSHNAETPGEVFRKALRYYSLNTGEGTMRGGMVDNQGVERALNGFGLYPDKQEIRDIFDAAGSPPGESAEVDKIVVLLCPPEPPMAPMF